MAAGGQRPPGQSGMGFFGDEGAIRAQGLALDGPQVLAGKRKIDTLTATDNAKAQKLKSVTIFDAETRDMWDRDKVEYPKHPWYQRQSPLWYSKTGGMWRGEIRQGRACVEASV